MSRQFSCVNLPRVNDGGSAEKTPSLDTLMHIHGWRARRKGAGWEIGPRGAPVFVRPRSKGAFDVIVGGESLVLPDERAVVDFLSQVALNRAREGSALS